MLKLLYKILPLFIHEAVEYLRERKRNKTIINQITKENES